MTDTPKYTDGEILDAIYDFIGNGCSLTPENFEEFMATFDHEDLDRCRLECVCTPEEKGETDD
jgi:hypothetical protein